jgi:hypothetical protein
VSFNIATEALVAIALIAAYNLQAHFIGLTLLRSKFKLNIVYKSGYQFSKWYYEFDTTTQSGTLVKVAWRIVGSDKHIYLNHQEIESITQIDSRVSVWRFFGKDI